MHREDSADRRVKGVHEAWHRQETGEKREAKKTWTSVHLLNRRVLTRRWKYGVNGKYRVKQSRWWCFFWRSEAEIQEMTRRTRKGRHRLGGGESEEEEEEEEAAS